MPEVTAVSGPTAAPTHRIELPVPQRPAAASASPQPPDRLELQSVQVAKPEESSGFWHTVQVVGQRTVEVLIGIPLAMVGFVIGPLVDAGRYVYKGIFGDPDDDTLAGRFVDDTRTNVGKIAKPLAPVAGAVVGLPAGVLQGTVEGLNFGANVGVNIGKWLTGDK